MGLLEDAIKEHLELKRRRGTSGDELDRIEVEALGDEPVHVNPTVIAQAKQIAEDRAEAEATKDEPVPASVPDPTSEPEPVPKQPPSPPKVPAEPAEPGEGDILEETPEFLEQSPDQDQLWFEQKPPKDFDF